MRENFVQNPFRNFVLRLKKLLGNDYPLHGGLSIFLVAIPLFVISCTILNATKDEELENQMQLPSDPLCDDTRARRSYKCTFVWSSSKQFFCVFVLMPLPEQKSSSSSSTTQHLIQKREIYVQVCSACAITVYRHMRHLSRTHKDKSTLRMCLPQVNYVQ